MKKKFLRKKVFSRISKKVQIMMGEPKKVELFKIEEKKK